MRNLYIVAAAAFLAAPGIAAAQEAAGDPQAGERVFNQCRACHMVGENAQNRVGPVLNDLFGREAGSLEDYNYSQAMQDYDVTWTHETFRTYIKDPRGEVPGTKMVYPGLRNDEQVTDLIAYLEQYDDDADDAAQ
ncbi:c-type cytochrome [Salinarimonas rosea]|uniref:c-type cytochrome n=1 Tax=Salinarimonas rosea TaxID=552063 RepID=UPI000402718D|nr:cytochrome c family protein [Salinarimonas rosea]